MSGRQGERDLSKKLREEEDVCVFARPFGEVGRDLFLRKRRTLGVVKVLSSELRVLNPRCFTNGLVAAERLRRSLGFCCAEL